MENPYNKVCVIGLGYIGLPTAAVIADQGIEVIGVDINPHTVDAVNQGEVHLVETGLDSLVRKSLERGKLRASTKPEKADAHIIAVPTPFKNKHIPDTSYIKAAAHSIAPVLGKGNTVILESTSPVGTTKNLAKWLQKDRPDLTFPTFGSRSEIDVFISYSPERVLPGNILFELVNNERVIGGLTSCCGEKAASLYRIFSAGNCLLTDAYTAELVKLAENAYRDVNIAFANELSLVCDKLGMNVWEVIKLANHHPRVNILNPGPGVGGHCIAVDPWFIADSAPDETALIQMARQVNDKKPNFIVKKIMSAAEENNIDTIICLGLAYKANIDDLRESPSVKVVKKLSKKFKGRILVVEPNINSLPKDLSDNPKINLVNNEDFLDDDGIIVLLTDHREFQDINIKQLVDRHVIDTRGVWA